MNRSQVREQIKVKTIRVFGDALIDEGGITVFRGVPFSGVGVHVGPDGQCTLVSYSAGVSNGEYQEPMLGVSGALFAYDDESETVLVPWDHNDTRFLDVPFTGYAIERNQNDADFVGSVSEYVAGRMSGTSVEWHPNGQLGELRQVHQLEGFREIESWFRWNSEGELTKSLVSARTDEQKFSTSSKVWFDDSGNVAEASFGEWDLSDGQTAALMDLLVDQVFLNPADLAGKTNSKKLRLIFGTFKDVDTAMLALLANGQMSALEELELASITPTALGAVLALPNLRYVRMSKTVPAECEALLKQWQLADPNRELVLFGT